MNEKPTHLDLFSGIGGFSLAFESIGFRTVGFSEIDPYANCILRKHWPTVTNYGDVRNVPAIKCDVLTGGFPCQPFSVAGKRAGKADDRYLWPEMCKVIERCRPTWVLGENVAGIVNMELDSVLSDLERIGYACQAFVVPACAVDARHRRDRVWIVGNANELQPRPGQQSTGDNETRLSGQTGATQTPLANRSSEPCGTGSKPNGSGIEIANGCENVAYSNQPGSQGWLSRELQECREQWTTRTSSPFMGDTTRELCEREGESRKGIGQSSDSSLWLPEPTVGRVVDGLPNRAHRLKCLGNSIVPQVAKVFAKAIYQQIVNENPNPRTSS